jgi:hypothetical protein
MVPSLGPLNLALLDRPGGRPTLQVVAGPFDRSDDSSQPASAIVPARGEGLG